MNRQVLERLVTDKRYFIENVLFIEDKETNLVPLRFNPIQENMYSSMTGRDIYLKPAQVGSTTLWMALFFHDCITKPGTNSVVVAYEEYLTQRLLKRVTSFTDQIAELSGFPKPHHKSSYEITWPEINSSFYIGTARAYVFGRGETIHNLLCSEYAFWPDTVRIMGPALQRVPLTGNLIIESTPNGDDNDFHDLYVSAKEMELIGASRFTHHFYTWNLHPEYQLPPDSIAALPRDRTTPLDYTEEEQDLIRKLGITEDQIRWRRMKIVELEQLRRDGASMKMFAQEFPEDDESCFLTAGDMLYDSLTLKEKLSKCYKAPSTHLGFYIWHKPEEGFRYMVSVDPGMAIESKTAITVWRFWWDGDNEYGQLCARKAGLIPPEKTSEELIDIARFYNKAVITGEANNHGLAVLAGLRGNYSNLYKRKDIVSNRTTLQPWWLTTPRTKPYMVREVAKMLDRLEIPDIDIIHEMRNMRVAGDAIGSTGSDDLHDSAAIAVACRQSRPIRKGYVGQAGWSW